MIFFCFVLKTLSVQKTYGINKGQAGGTARQGSGGRLRDVASLGVEKWNFLEMKTEKLVRLSNQPPGEVPGLWWTSQKQPGATGPASIRFQIKKRKDGSERTAQSGKVCLD